MENDPPQRMSENDYLTWDFRIDTYPWHKRENVASKIPHADVAEQVRNEMEAAYADAKKNLTELMKRLDARSPAAASSVREGLEETLTLHKLGIPKPLRDQLRTTNIMERVNSRLAHTTRRISRWQNSDQRQRWVAPRAWT